MDKVNNIIININIDKISFNWYLCVCVYIYIILFIYMNKVVFFMDTNIVLCELSKIDVFWLGLFAAKSLSSTYYGHIKLLLNDDKLITSTDSQQSNHYISAATQISCPTVKSDPQGIVWNGRKSKHWIQVDWDFLLQYEKSQWYGSIKKWTAADVYIYLYMWISQATFWLCK